MSCPLFQIMEAQTISYLLFQIMDAQTSSYLKLELVEAKTHSLSALSSVCSHGGQNYSRSIISKKGVLTISCPYVLEVVMILFSPPPLESLPPPPSPPPPLPPLPRPDDRILRSRAGHLQKFQILLTQNRAPARDSFFVFFFVFAFLIFIS